MAASSEARSTGDAGPPPPNVPQRRAPGAAFRYGPRGGAARRRSGIGCGLARADSTSVQEILIGLAGPTGRPAGTDFASYWRACCAGDEGPDLAHARFVRLVASAYARPSGVVGKLHKLIGAALAQAAAVSADRRLDFQGHVIEAGDFLATWAVEGAVHHLDLTVELPGTPPPAPGALAVVRETLDALLGGTAPAGWDDATYALKGTGRLALTGEDREALGDLAGRFPLFG
jgi:hypothetical protein